MTLIQSMIFTRRSVKRYTILFMMRHAEKDLQITKVESGDNKHGIGPVSRTINYQTLRSATSSVPASTSRAHPSAGRGDESQIYAPLRSCRLWQNNAATRLGSTDAPSGCMAIADPG